MKKLVKHTALIYEDPITQKNLEGEAILLYKYDDRDPFFDYWDVRIIKGADGKRLKYPYTARRKIFIPPEERKQRQIAKQMLKDYCKAAVENYLVNTPDGNIDGVTLSLARNLLITNPEIRQYFENSGIKQYLWASVLSNYVSVSKTNTDETNY